MCHAQVWAFFAYIGSGHPHSNLMEHFYYSDFADGNTEALLSFAQQFVHHLSVP